MISVTSVQAQCPSGWQSIATFGHAVGWNSKNVGGGVNKGYFAIGSPSFTEGQSGLSSSNTGYVDRAGEYLMLNMGELVTGGSTMTMVLGYFTDPTSRMKIEYSADIDTSTWTTLGYYSGAGGTADEFEGTLGSAVAEYFDFTVPA